MRNRKKQLLLLLVFVALLFLASGCTSPVDPETKEVIQITSDTTFKYMMANELVQCILRLPVSEVG